MPRMAGTALGAVQEGDDRTSHLLSHSLSNSLSSREDKAAEFPSPPPVLPEAACLGLGSESAALARGPPRLHEPFVSPEFAGEIKRATRLAAGVSWRADGDDGGVISTESIRESDDVNSWWEQPEGQLLPPQAAPLYTVRAGAGATRNVSNRDVLVALPSPLPPSVKLAKSLAVTAAGCSSVVKSSTTIIDDRAVAKETDQRQRQRQAEVSFKSSEKAPPSTLPEVEAGSGIPPQQQSRGPCKDLSSLVTEATCSWGQELEKILGQAVPDLAATAVGSSTAMFDSPGRLALTTTGLFPQTMHLRFSSPVCVSSVHVRASSVLRLVVKPAGKLSESEEEVGGKAVTVVPSCSINSTSSSSRSHGGPTSEPSAQDIDVDVRGVPSFQSTRSISVTITSGSGAFCSVLRIYALGTQA